MPSSIQKIPVENREMDLYLSLPEGAGPFPAIVVGQHAGGVDEFIRGMSDRLAEAGYCAAAPDLYHRLAPEDHSPRSLKDAEMIADVQATVAFLKAHPSVNGESLGVTGFCMGGRVAYLMAAAVPEFKAAVAYYGGNTMVALGEEGAASPFDRTKEIACPLMFHFGEQDKNPSPEDRIKLDAELTRHNKKHEFYSYPDAGHAFMDFAGERYREAADKASWPRTLDFFAKYLRA